MASDSDQAPHYVNQRVLRALTPALSYGQAFGAALSRKWSAEDPDGNIICSIAENKLTADMMHEKMCSVQKDMPVSVMSYPASFRGCPEAREAFAHMMSRTFMRGVAVEAADLALLSGAGACLDLLFWCLLGSGDGVLLPSPIYPAFINDMEVRDSAHPVLFALDEGGDVSGQLDCAAAGAAAEGHPVKVMLLCNPNNPTGIVYQSSTVRDILCWCLKNHVHFISDEIYALSVWDKRGPEFVSTAVLAQREVAEGNITTKQAELLPLLLHTVCGLSKDFCASGLRVGVLHTRNPTLMQMLNDDAFVDAFILENCKRMKAAYQGLSESLNLAFIPYVNATAAMFCWVDLREGLLRPGWEGERDLWQALIKIGVLLTPGEACRAEEPGFFRICWAWCPAEALPHAAHRMGQLMEERKRMKAQLAAGV